MLRQVSLLENYMKTYSGLVYTYSETLVLLHLLKKIFLCTMSESFSAKIFAHN